jgi:hypothetical protein
MIDLSGLALRSVAALPRRLGWNLYERRAAELASDASPGSPWATRPVLWHFGVGLG